MRFVSKLVSWICVGIVCVTALSSCEGTVELAPPDGIRSPIVYLSFAPYDVNGVEARDVGVCIREVIFYSTDTSRNPIRVNIELEETLIVPSGVALGTIRGIRAATYYLIDVVLEAHCLSASSIRLINNEGYFSSPSRSVMRFRGAKALGFEEEANLELDPRGLIVGLGGVKTQPVNTDDEIQRTVQSLEGSF